MRSTLLAILLACGTACGTKHKLADEETLRQRCAALNLTCDVQWRNYDASSGSWMAAAKNANNDWWFAHASTRAVAIDELNTELGGNPTNPADPLPEVIYKAK
jgi:hypothetical protein